MNTQHEPVSEEGDKPVRRSTVREKVSFGSSSTAVPETSAPHSTAEPAQSAEPAPEASSDGQPRKAGWWSRRFGGG
jgi:ribonuclease E